jgi:hypothetical protein
MIERPDAGQEHERNEAAIYANVAALYSKAWLTMDVLRSRDFGSVAPSPNGKNPRAPTCQEMKTRRRDIIVSGNVERNELQDADGIMIVAGPALAGFRARAIG